MVRINIVLETAKNKGWYIKKGWQPDKEMPAYLCFKYYLFLLNTERIYL